MARRPRTVVPGVPMHLVQRGNNRSPTFFADTDYSYYLECLRMAVEKSGCEIHAYVLMTNHVHLLVTPRETDSVSLLMQSVGRRYVRYINSVYQRSGTLWEGRYKSVLIDSEGYLLTCYRYIELNPVRANMVKLPEEYTWSSHAVNAHEHSSPLITPHALYMRLGNSQKIRASRYRALFTAHIDQQALDRIRSATQNEAVLGSHRFQEEIEQVVQRRVVRSAHGGDRRSQRFSSTLTP